MRIALCNNDFFNLNLTNILSFNISSIDGNIIQSSSPVNPLDLANVSYLNSKLSVINANNITNGIFDLARFPIFNGDFTKSLGSAFIGLNAQPYTQGTYGKVRVNNKGLVTEVFNTVDDVDISDINFNKITNKPTTLTGYGITDGVSKSSTSTINGNLYVVNNPNPNSIVNISYVDSLFNSFSTGTILKHTNDTNIDGYLKCNGVLLNKYKYSNLYYTIKDTLSFTYNTTNGEKWKHQHNINYSNTIIDTDFKNEPELMPDVYSHGMGVFVTKNRVYFVGGRDNGSLTNTNLIRTAKISPDGILEKVENSSIVFPIAVAHAECIVIKNKVYVIGGYIGGNISSPYIAINEVYSADILQDGTITTFSLVSTLPAQLGCSKLFATYSYLYVIGGYLSGSANSSDSVYMAPINPDGTLGSWVSNSTLPTTDYNYSKLPYVNGAFDIAVTNRYLYVIGGNSFGTTCLRTICRADIRADGTIGNFYTIENQLPNAIRAHSIINTKNRIYIIGGLNSAGSALRTIYTAQINPDDSLGVIEPLRNGSINILTSVVTSYSSLFITSSRVYIAGLYNGSITSNIIQSVKFEGGYNNYVTDYYHDNYNEYNCDIGNGEPWKHLYNIDTIEQLTGVSNNLGAITIVNNVTTSNVAYFGVIVTKNKAYLLGGIDINSNTIKEEYYVYNITNSPTGTLSTYNTYINGLLPMPMHGFGTVVTRNKAYIIGGITDNGYSNKIYVSNIDYDGNLSSFIDTGILLPTAIANPIVFIIKGKLIVTGGTIISNNAVVFNDTIYSYNIDLNGNIFSNSTNIGTLINPCLHASVEIINNKVYILGGLVDSTNITTNIQCLVFSEDGNSINILLNDISLPVALCKFTTATRGNRLYIFGGTTSNGVSTIIYSSEVTNDGKLKTFNSTAKGVITLGTPFLATSYTRIFSTSNNIFLLSPVGNNVSYNNGCMINIPNGLSDYSDYYNGNIVSNTENRFNGSVGNGRPWQYLNDVVVDKDFHNKLITATWTKYPFTNNYKLSGVIALNNSVYTLAGYSGSSSLSIIMKGTIDNNNQLTFFNYTNATLPSALEWCKTIVIKNKVHLIGNNGNYNVNRVITGEITKNEELHSFRYTIPLPYITHVFPLFLAVKNKVYLACGFNGSTNNPSTYIGNVDKNGYITDWERSADLVIPVRESVDLCVNDSRLYIFGGVDNAGAIISDIQYADINEDGTISKWNTYKYKLPINTQFDANGLPTHSTICEFRIIVINNTIYLFGGLIYNLYTITKIGENNIIYAANILDNNDISEFYTFGATIHDAANTVGFAQIYTGEPVVLNNKLYIVQCMNTNNASTASVTNTYELNLQINNGNDNNSFNAGIIDRNKIYNERFVGNGKPWKHQYNISYYALDIINPIKISNIASNLIDGGKVLVTKKNITVIAGTLSGVNSILKVYEAGFNVNFIPNTFNIIPSKIKTLNINTHGHTNFDIVPIANKVYIINGISGSSNTGTASVYSINTDDDGILAQDVIYDHGTTPFLSHKSNCFIVKNKVYAISNGTSVGETTSSIMASEILGNDKISSFVYYDSLPYIVDSHDVAITDKYVYIIGGKNNINTPMSTIVSIPIKNNGKLGTSVILSQITLPIPLYDFKTFVTKSRIYIIGGRTTNGAISDNIYVADLDSNGIITNIRANSQKLPIPLTDFYIAAFSNKLFIFGGTTIVSGTEVRNNDLYYYNISNISTSDFTSYIYGNIGPDVIFGIPDIPQPDKNGLYTYIKI